MSAHHDLEEGSKLSLDFTKLGMVASGSGDVIPVVVQDVVTKEVLLVAYVNQAALDRSLSTGLATFWSTSRRELWVKGASSGDFLDLKDVRVNCEQNSLLFLVLPRAGGVCHTKQADGQTRRLASTVQFVMDA
ncbi:MAG: phosphoribosyl-AMP cyclohydrolase [Opitutaceae bacterium]